MKEHIQRLEAALGLKATHMSAFDSITFSTPAGVAVLVLRLDKVGNATIIEHLACHWDVYDAVKQAIAASDSCKVCDE